MENTHEDMDMYNKECSKVILMLHRKQSRSNAQITDDNGHSQKPPNSCTTISDDDADIKNDTAHVDNNYEEEIPYLPAPQLVFDVVFQLE